MLYTIQILVKESGILLFEERLKDIDYNSKLFSALLTAIQGFCIDINIGECNTFSSDKFKVIATSTNSIIIALIIEKKDPHPENFWKNLCLEIGSRFEKDYNLNKFKGKINQFKGFSSILHKILA
ncbi:MAG: hypothetical protein ACFFCM_10060, partial [Promethearchaeota archaeon]